MYQGIARVLAENLADTFPKTRYLIGKTPFVTSRCCVRALVGWPPGRPTVYKLSGRTGTDKRYWSYKIMADIISDFFVARSTY